MRGKKTLVSLLCTSAILFNTNSLSANPGISDASNASIKQVKQKMVYDFSDIFAEGFQWQNTIEDLISYTYSRYNRAIKKIKISYPEITLEDIVDTTNFWDRLRFSVLLCIDYYWNLNRLGYRIEDVKTEGDDLRISFLDKKKLEEKSAFPYLRLDIDVSSIPDYMNVGEIRKFLDSDNSYLFKTENGKFFYSIFRSAKKKI